MRVRSSSALALLAATALSLGPLTAAPAAPRNLGAAVAPVRLIPKGGGPLVVSDLHSYLGSIELTSASDGLVVSDRLSLERYLLGLNEVPTTWPAEALKAQAVAARTYALFTLAQPPAGAAATYGFDICASVDCQVFSGADVVDTAAGERWAAAVEATEGEAILYEGRPILARYHSTSGGQTFDNEQVFPEEGSYPYLQGVSSTTEQGSPLYRWVTTFSLRDLQAILEDAGWWSATNGRLRNVASIDSSSGLHYPDLVFEGPRGRLRRTAEELRDVVRDVAPRLFPGKYPSASPSGTGRLPETFPSNRISVFTRRGTVRVIGRGWGHGTGMSQWGAHGLALQGASYVDILTHYYSGVTVETVDTSEPIEVGVDWGRSSVSVTGSFEIVDGRGKTVVENAIGTWGFAPAGPGAVSIDPPKGFGLPLKVGIVGAPRTVDVGEPAFLTVALSRPATVRSLTSSAPTGYRDPGSKISRAGRQRVPWLAPLEPGRYEVRIRASTGATVKESETVSIVVREPVVPGADSPAPAAGGSSEEGGGTIFLVVALACGAVVIVLSILGRRRGG